MRIFCLLGLFINYQLSPLASATTSYADENFMKLFDDITQTVNENFYDQTHKGLPWTRLTRLHRNRLAKYQTEKNFIRQINLMLGMLNTSHTKLYSTHDQTYWALKSIFSREINGFPINQIGAWFFRINGKWFIRDIFPNSPAEKSGLSLGDEILLANNHLFNPIKSFSAGSSVTLLIRKCLHCLPVAVQVRPQLEGLQKTLLRASKDSVTIIKTPEKKIGYYHLWARTHDDFLLDLSNSLQSFEKNTDALILDIRDGFGGADQRYIELFFSKDKEPAVYSKPVVLLINEGTRSGKETIAWEFKRRKRAVLVGTTTAGAYIGGRPYYFKDRYLLYLAVFHDPSAPPIEGNGVKPHVVVPMPLMYTGGADPQLQKALKVVGQ